ncbi:MAG TPA: CDP-glycerol glycerophosphotransferase family protein [Ruania sp.]|nr:CDP-glycerol glycerophosphotransferase family protein [Ruania sp.]
MLAAHVSRNPIAWISVILLALIPLGEPVLSRVSRGRRLRCAGLPGVRLRNSELLPMNVILTVDLIVTFVVTVAIAGHVWSWALLLFVLIAIALAATAAVDTLQRVRKSVVVDNELYSSIEAYAPRFILYYGVPTGSEYQVEMWIRYLERIGEPFIVILRHVSTFTKISVMTSAPVIVRTSMRQLDDVVVPSVTTAFYVNNGALNVHLVRYPQITHVQLLHGDSDKATSFNPITAMFDKIFVAGQAAIDRYTNNDIDIPLHKFQIVGRPQVEDVKPQTSANTPVRTVLYAPTWEGHFADTNYSSVTIAPQMIQSLLRRQIRVIFRPHPYSYRNEESRGRIEEIHELLAADQEANQRAHVWGETAENAMSIFDCFNAADAMVSDVSSVVPDFLHSAKPFAMFAMTGSPEEFETEFPLARASYVIKQDLSNLESALDDLLVHDSKKEQRHQARIHYLGPFEPENYSDVFVRAARQLVLQQPANGAPTHIPVDDEHLIEETTPEETAPPEAEEAGGNHDDADGSDGSDLSDDDSIDDGSAEQDTIAENNVSEEITGTT